MSAYYFRTLCMILMSTDDPVLYNSILLYEGKYEHKYNAGDAIDSLPIYWERIRQNVLKAPKIYKELCVWVMADILNVS